MIGTKTNSPLLMLPSLLQWWCDRLMECVPDRLLARRVPVIFTVKANGALADDPLPKVTSLKSSKDQAWWRVLLLMPPNVILELVPGRILKRRVILPEAVKADPTRAIHYELDRLTPFEPEDIVWSLQHTPDAAPPGQIAFDLFVVPKIAFTAALNQLEAHDVTPDRLRARPHHGQEWNTVPLARNSHRRHYRSRLVMGALAALVLVPFIVQQFALSHTAHRLASLDSGRARAEALRHQILMTQLGPEAVKQEEKRTGVPLEILARLTEALPDDTYLTSLHLHNRQIALEGQSGHATRLIVTLRQAENFSNVAFSGPVVRSENHQSDLFSLTAVASDAASNRTGKP